MISSLLSWRRSGYLDWDNTILADEPLTYYAHTVTSGSAGVEVPDYKGDGRGQREPRNHSGEVCGGRFPGEPYHTGEALYGSYLPQRAISRL